MDENCFLSNTIDMTELVHKRVRWGLTCETRTGEEGEKEEEEKEEEKGEGEEREGVGGTTRREAATLPATT